jgi:hypothetical protein
MKINTTLAVSIIALTFLFAGCTKTETGPTGATGATGATGNTGANGATDVQSYSGSIAITSWTLTNNNTEWDATIPVIYSSVTNTGIGTSVMNAGTVQAFIGDTSKWTALPYSHDTLQYNYSYQLNSVTIQVSTSNGTKPNNPGIVGLKVIVIPPDRLMRPHIDVHYYYEVQKAYKLSIN